MLEAVRRYARKVLLFHLVLLGIVVLIVLGAARSVYRSARQQAIKENEKRLQLLADQTSRGIENYYLGVMSDLEAFLHSESDAPATQPARPQRPGERIMNRLRNVNGVNPGIINDLYKQLHGRVSDLFLVDRQTGDVWGAQGNKEEINAIARSQQEWIAALKEPAMSRFQPGTDATKGGYHLIAIPTEGRRPEPPPSATAPAPPGPPVRRPANTPQIIVAVVPVQPVNDRFLDAINDEGVVNAALLDDAGTVLASIDPQLAGKNAIDEMSPNARALIAPFATGTKDGSVVIPFTYQVGSISFEPRILAFHSIISLPGRRWTVLTSAPLSDAESVVKDLFGEAMIWAIFVSLSVTGILVSTAFFMIRSRVRYERAPPRDLLARELDQARQIQLAWLPDAEKPPRRPRSVGGEPPGQPHLRRFLQLVPPPSPGSYSKHTAEPQDEAAEGSKIAIVIGDVTGHGMAAAFLMATTQLLVRTTLSRYQDPGRCLQEVNRQLCTQGFRGQFVTMLVMVLDPRSSSIEIATAGHPAPLVERQGKFESLEMEPQLVLGVDPTETYKTEGFILEPGASIMLYTDGVVEAEASSGEQYGLERLCAALSTDRAEKEPQAAGSRPCSKM